VSFPYPDGTEAFSRGDPEGPGDSFRPTVPSARAQAPASPSAGPRVIGPRRFWLPCVRAFLKDWGRDQAETDVLPQSKDRSTDGRIEASRRRKTPLVLPYEGERRKGSGFAEPPKTGPLPRRERRKGSGFANLRKQVLSPAGGRRLSAGERQRGSPSQEAAGPPLERVLLAGRDARGPGFANLRDQVLSCEGEDPSCSPLWRGETQGLGVRRTSEDRSSPSQGPSQGAVGHPLERDRRSCNAKKGAVREESGLCSRAALGPSAQGDGGLVSSSS